MEPPKAPPIFFKHEWRRGRRKEEEEEEKGRREEEERKMSPPSIWILAPPLSVRWALCTRRRLAFASFIFSLRGCVPRACESHNSHQMVGDWEWKWLSPASTPFSEAETPLQWSLGPAETETWVRVAQLLRWIALRNYAHVTVHSTEITHKSWVI